MTYATARIVISVTMTSRSPWSMAQPKIPAWRGRGVRIAGFDGLGEGSAGSAAVFAFDLAPQVVAGRVGPRDPRASPRRVPRSPGSLRGVDHAPDAREQSRVDGLLERARAAGAERAGRGAAGGDHDGGPGGRQGAWRAARPSRG